MLAVLAACSATTMTSENLLLKILSVSSAACTA